MAIKVFVTLVADQINKSMTIIKARKGMLIYASVYVGKAIGNILHLKCETVIL